VHPVVKGLLTSLRAPIISYLKNSRLRKNTDRPSGSAIGNECAWRLSDIVIYITCMEILIRAGDELPIYRQIMNQITQALAIGRLCPGDKLPSHRELAEELVIAPLTVKKAYDELESLGFIETQRGRGTFVCLKLPKLKMAEQREPIEAAARKLLSLSYMVGLDFQGTVSILKKVEKELLHELPAADAGKATKEEL
jgi:GntR family transcriptional regulator